MYHSCWYKYPLLCQEVTCPQNLAHPVINSYKIYLHWVLHLAWQSVSCAFPSSHIYSFGLFMLGVQHKRIQPTASIFSLPPLKSSHIVFVVMLARLVYPTYKYHCCLDILSGVLSYVQFFVTRWWNICDFLCWTFVRRHFLWTDDWMQTIVQWHINW